MVNIFPIEAELNTLMQEPIKNQRGEFLIPTKWPLWYEKSRIIEKEILLV